MMLSRERAQEADQNIYLVDFKKINVIHLEASSFHCCRDCNGRTNTHYSWINSDSGKGPTFAHSDILLSLLTEIYNN